MCGNLSLATCPGQKIGDIFCCSRNPHYSTLLWIILKSIILAINFYFAVVELKIILKWRKEHNFRCWKYTFFKKLVFLLCFCQCFFLLLKYIWYKQVFWGFWFFWFPSPRNQVCIQVTSPWYIFSDSWIVLEHVL